VQKAHHPPHRALGFAPGVLQQFLGGPSVLPLVDFPPSLDPSPPKVGYAIDDVGGDGIGKGRDTLDGVALEAGAPEGGRTGPLAQLARGAFLAKNQGSP